MTTPSIPGIDRDDLFDAILRATRPITLSSARRAADTAIAYIAAHHECACDREHADEWVEVDEGTFHASPDGTRLRAEWAPDRRYFVHRDDLPDPDADLVERMAKAIHVRDCGCDGLDECVEPEDYRAMARAALAVVREDER